MVSTKTTIPGNKKYVLQKCLNDNLLSSCSITMLWSQMSLQRILKLTLNTVHWSIIKYYTFSLKSACFLLEDLLSQLKRIEMMSGTRAYWINDFVVLCHLE